MFLKWLLGVAIWTYGLKTDCGVKYSDKLSDVNLWSILYFY